MFEQVENVLPVYFVLESTSFSYFDIPTYKDLTFIVSFAFLDTQDANLLYLV